MAILAPQYFSHFYFIFLHQDIDLFYKNNSLFSSFFYTFQYIQNPLFPFISVAHGLY